MNESSSLCTKLLEVFATLPSGVNVFAYVVESGRYGELDAKIAQTVTKYLFDGAEERPNLVIVMTKCTRQQLNFSPEKKAEWLNRQSEQNKHFMSLYRMVNQDPSRLFMVDNQDEEDMRDKNEKGIKPLQRYILNIDSTLRWHDARLLERLSELDEEIGYLRSRTPEAMEKREQENREKAEEELKQLHMEHEIRLKKAEEERKKIKQEMENRVQARSESDSGCFGGLCEVLVRDRGIVKMCDLAVGDMVASGQGRAASRLVKSLASSQLNKPQASISVLIPEEGLL